MSIFDAHQRSTGRRSACYVCGDECWLEFAGEVGSIWFTLCGYCRSVVQAVHDAKVTGYDFFLVGGHEMLRRLAT